MLETLYVEAMLEALALANVPHPTTLVITSGKMRWLSPTAFFQVEGEPVSGMPDCALAVEQVGILYEWLSSLAHPEQIGQVISTAGSLTFVFSEGRNKLTIPTVPVPVELTDLDEIVLKPLLVNDYTARVTQRYFSEGVLLMSAIPYVEGRLFDIKFETRGEVSFTYGDRVHNTVVALPLVDSYKVTEWSGSFSLDPLVRLNSWAASDNDIAVQLSFTENTRSLKSPLVVTMSSKFNKVTAVLAPAWR